MKKLIIYEVKATRSSIAPFQIVLEGNPLGQEGKSFFMVDKDTCSRFGIPMSLNLVGRTLVFYFENRELPLQTDGCFKGHMNAELLNADDLMIHSLYKKESTSFLYNTRPQSKHIKVSRVLELVSFGGGEGFLPCPFYQIAVELTEEEYEECIVLSPISVIRVSLLLVLV